MSDEQLEQLASRIEALEARVAELESGGVSVSPAPAPPAVSAPTPTPTPAPAQSAPAVHSNDRSTPVSDPVTAAVSEPASAGGPGWTQSYRVAELSVSETWIEMHEPSARPQLQRLIRETVAAEGPITQALALRRVREAWGLKRAGQRIQQVFDQSVRQLVAAGYLERRGDAVIEQGQELDVVRVPSDDERSRRAADEVPALELELALVRVATDAGALAADELTAVVSRLFGWTRRGAGIQAVLDERLDSLVRGGALEREEDMLRAPSVPVS